jgi:hypothetical protein
LLAALVVVLILKLLERPLLHSDPLFIKRFMLSSSAGLFLLIAINKILAAPDLAPLAVPFALGVFVAYLFHPRLNSLPQKSKNWLLFSACCFLAIISVLVYGLFSALIIFIAMLLSVHRAYKAPIQS